MIIEETMGKKELSASSSVTNRREFYLICPLKLSANGNENIRMAFDSGWKVETKKKTMALPCEPSFTKRYSNLIFLCVNRPHCAISSKDAIWEGTKKFNCSTVETGYVTYLKIFGWCTHSNVLTSPGSIKSIYSILQMPHKHTHTKKAQFNLRDSIRKALVSNRPLSTTLIATLSTQKKNKMFNKRDAYLFAFSFAFVLSTLIRFKSYLLSIDESLILREKNCHVQYRHKICRNRFSCLKQPIYNVSQDLCLLRMNWMFVWQLWTKDISILIICQMYWIN